jgi:1-aminocyclopropane-1-carboxylate deaminase/D-cysteine desulfhydrase-like pyridoxal-dependent ACC family enzyme
MARLALGDYPTPALHLPAAGLWIKRDDRSASLYGGNKVRKLEHLLGEARARGKTRIVTLGAAGSHQLVATALFGRREGFDVDAVVVAQPPSEHGVRNLRVALAAGLRPAIAPSWLAVPAVLAQQLGRDAYLVPLGGSNAVGSLGFVEAARELAGQVERGALPEPDVVVVAMGSGGTAAGLAVGFEAAGMRTKVVGVAISSPLVIVSSLGRRLVTRTALAAGLPRSAATAALARLEVDGRWLGRGYGYATPEGEVAMRRASSEGVTLDPTYTAKAFACALERARRKDERVLYWHTLSSAPLDGLHDGDAKSDPLPPELGRLFRG